MQTGKVNWFNGSDGKRYGFLDIEGQEKQLFFHYNDVRLIVAGEKEPVFQKNFSEKMGLLQRPIRDPKPGDIIMFEIIQGSKGLKASPWGYKTYYDSAKYAITHRLPRQFIVLQSQQTLLAINRQNQKFCGKDRIWMNF